jgi:DNA-binding LacI/PurR family transcriptional regulator
LCGHPVAEPECYSLRFDIERGINELLEYVISCGHKKIGMIVPATDDPQDVIINTLRSAFSNALRAHRCTVRPDFIATASFNNLQTAETALNKLFKVKPAPTAIFCTSDHFAYIAYRILKKWKIRVPLDISIVGFDGISIPTHLETPTPILTTVATDQIQLGRESVSLLKKIIFNPNEKEKTHILPIHLRIGDSVKRLH